MTEFPQIDSGLAVPVFNTGDDLIACLNKAMAFLTAVSSSRFPSTNNQLRTSSNLRNQAIIQDGRVTVQQVQGRQGQSYASNSYKGPMARQCTRPKRPRNAAWFKEKAMLAEAQEAGQILDEEQLAFLADPGIPDGQDVQTTIPNTNAFHTEDLDAYDSDCDDVSNAKAVLMANLSSYCSDVLSEVPHSETSHNDMDNQSVHVMQDFEQTLIVDFLDNEITSDSNIIPYSQYLQETQLAAVQDTILYAQQDLMILSVIEQITREKMIDSQMDNMIKEKLALKQQIDSLEQNLSNQIKEKESLLQTFTVFKNESKEKENEYIDKEINLEKKIKELDNIFNKVVLGLLCSTSAEECHFHTSIRVFSTWMAFGGNTRDLGSFGEEMNEITDLHQILEEVLLTERGDGVTCIKRCHHDPSSDGIRDLVTESRRSRLNEDLESSM
ncbi:hypothetical protein Tco_1317198 [Tanacetum coccineum]